MYKIRATLAVSLLFVLAVPASAAEAAEPRNKLADTGQFFFHKGDRIVFLGDSITEQYQYSTCIELYLTTRCPDWDLVFLNAGIGGDTATGGAGRFAEHVLAEKPTAITIDFGMNDGGYGGFNPQRARQYVQKTRAMLEAARKAGVRVALISPNAVDWRRRNRVYLETQKRFYAPLKQLAEEFNLAFVDQYAVTRTALEKIEHDRAASANPFPDGVHTSGQGGLLMAHTILVGLHAPTLVSDVTIDITGHSAKGQKCTLDGLKCTKKSVIFDRTDEALPLPVARDWQPVLPYVDHLKDLNWYGLTVTGLNAGKYRLKIDNKEMGSYSADELAQGMNLGNLTTGPLYEQGEKVFRAINAKNDIVHRRFRDVVMFRAPAWLAEVVAERKPKELESRMTQIALRQAEIYKLVHPVKHHFALEREENEK